MKYITIGLLMTVMGALSYNWIGDMTEYCNADFCFRFGEIYLGEEV